MTKPVVLQVGDWCTHDFIFNSCPAQAVYGSEALYLNRLTDGGWEADVFCVTHIELDGSAFIEWQEKRKGLEADHLTPILVVGKVKRTKWALLEKVGSKPLEHQGELVWLEGKARSQLGIAVDRWWWPHLKNTTSQT